MYIDKRTNVYLLIVFVIGLDDILSRFSGTGILFYFCFLNSSNDVKL